jgi:LuxR family maltose regulon positive regulatory protein
VASFDLVDAKLRVPKIRLGTVPKTDVITELRACRHPVVTVVAPAGYGKTTLLSQWAEADARPFAWVALDEQDSDAVVFLRSFAAAVNQVESLAPEVFDGLAGPGSTIWGTHVRNVGNVLVTLEHPLVVVLDDLHAVDNPLCFDVLTNLFAYLPAGSQIAMASREDPPLPLARWRAQGIVRELGVNDLRLDEQQAGLLFRGAGVETGNVDMADLTERTEGWPSGLYLAALSLRNGSPGTTPAQAFADDDRFISDFLRLEVLSRLPEVEARFLKHTSVLDKFSGPLCDAALDTTDSAKQLDSLKRSNYFVVPLDNRSEWFRYHHLFRKLLRNELDRTEPDAAADIINRAAAWCLKNNLPEAAVTYAHAAGDTETVAGLVDRLGLSVYYDGRIDTIEEWLGWFKDSNLVKYPAIAMIGAWIRASTGRPDEAKRWLSFAEGADLPIPLSDGSSSIVPWVANLRAHIMPNGLDAALADANTAVEGLSQESGWRPSALGIRGTINALLGESERAVVDIAAAVDVGRAIGAADSVFFMLGQLSLVAARRGDWGEAGRLANEAQTVVEETGLHEYMESVSVHVAMARVAIHEGRQVDARRALGRAHRLRPVLLGLPWLTIQIGHELTRAHLALGEAAAAQTVYSEARKALSQNPDLGYLVEESRELGVRLEATSTSDGAWAMSLTGAELRLLPYLSTHLTFSEIASRLFISPNTVKSQAASTYRKLGATTRSQAIERAIEVGFLDSSIYPQPVD